jgi:hypothetical protein
MEALSAGFKACACFTGTPFRDKIDFYPMRRPSANPDKEMPPLKRFRRRRPDRGRRTSR